MYYIICIIINKIQVFNDSLKHYLIRVFNYLKKRGIIMFKNLWIGILMIGNWIWSKLKIGYKFVVDFIEAFIIGVGKHGVSPNARYGYKPDLPDQRDYIFSEMISNKPAVLPTSVDLRSTCSPVEDQGNLGSCHDDQTEVLTNNGWKLFKDINKDDLLATVDLKTKNLYYESPFSLQQYAYDGNLICANNNAFNFKVTPNHNMVVRKWNEKERSLSEDYEFIPAKDLGWYVGFLNKINWKIDCKNSITIPGIDHKHKLQRNDLVLLMSTFLRFLGVYLAEGTIVKSWMNTKHYKFQLACSKIREKTFIKQLLEEMNIKYCELKDRITFENKQLYNFMESLGLKSVYASNKFVPKFVFYQSSDDIKQFLLGHFMGDGCEQDGFKSHYTSSRQLAEDLQLLIFISGVESRIYSRPPRNSIMKDGRIIKGNYPEYRISVCEKKYDSSLNKKESIFEEYYKGIVYCAEVPTYHTLITRRGNKILVSGNCTANGLVGALEFIENKNKDKFIDLSRLFVYYNERVIEGTTKSDSGAYIRDGIKALANQGVCPEKDWPYNISQFTKKPSTVCYTEALQHTITTYARVLTLNDMKTALASGYPFVFGITVYSSFESATATKTGNIPMPKPKESVLGGHCMLCVGYDDSKQVFIFRNSWSSSWGNKGYGTIPYAYLTNTNLASDMWVITKEKNF